MVDAMLHDGEVGRLQGHHVDADMTIVVRLHGDVRGGAADIVESRGAVVGSWAAGCSRRS